MIFYIDCDYRAVRGFHFGWLVSQTWYNRKQKIIGLLVFLAGNEFKWTIFVMGVVYNAWTSNIFEKSWTDCNSKIRSTSTVLTLSILALYSRR
jgi:hypothetical protein